MYYKMYYLALVGNFAATLDKAQKLKERIEHLEGCESAELLENSATGKIILLTRWNGVSNWHLADSIVTPFGSSDAFEGSQQRFYSLPLKGVQFNACPYLLIKIVRTIS